MITRGERWLLAIITGVLVFFIAWWFFDLPVAVVSLLQSMLSVHALCDGLNWTGSPTLTEPAEDVVELGLCEQDGTYMRPDVLYRFSVRPDCEACYHYDVYADDPDR